MNTIAPATAAGKDDAISKKFDETFGVIARRCVRVWFNQGRLDEVLADLFIQFPYCELVYAFDPDGRQVSSNISRGEIDRSAYGQDLAQRPIAVSLSVLNNAEQRGVFLANTHVSQVTRHPCVTVMYRVTSGSDLMGFLAADFVPEDLDRDTGPGSGGR